MPKEVYIAIWLVTTCVLAGFPSNTTESEDSAEQQSEPISRLYNNLIQTDP